MGHTILYTPLLGQGLLVQTPVIAGSSSVPFSHSLSGMLCSLPLQASWTVRDTHPSSHSGAPRTMGPCAAPTAHSGPPSPGEGPEGCLSSAFQQSPPPFSPALLTPWGKSLPQYQEPGLTAPQLMENHAPCSFQDPLKYPHLPPPRWEQSPRQQDGVLRRARQKQREASQGPGAQQEPTWGFPTAITPPAAHVSLPRGSRSVSASAGTTTSWCTSLPHTSMHTHTHTVQRRRGVRNVRPVPMQELCCLVILSRCQWLTLGPKPLVS